MKGSIFTQEHICNDFLQQLFKWNKLAALCGFLLSAAPFLSFSFLCCRKCFCKFIKTEFYFFLNLSLCEYDMNVPLIPYSPTVFMFCPLSAQQLTTSQSSTILTAFSMLCDLLWHKRPRRCILSI